MGGIHKYNIHTQYGRYPKKTGEIHKYKRYKIRGDIHMYGRHIQYGRYPQK